MTAKRAGLGVHYSFNPYVTVNSECMGTAVLTSR